MVVIPPKPPTNTSHTTRTTGQGCRTRPTPPHHLRHRQQPHPLKHPKHPISPTFHRGGLHFEQPPGRFTTIDPSTGTRRWPFRATTGGFATIDPRHAGDTPQGSAYGSNSPQATNKDKPHHHDTRDIPPATTANPSHQRRRNRATAQPRAGGTPRGYSKRGRHQPTPCASALTRP